MYRKREKRAATITHIVVHCTATNPDMLVRDMEQLPYHFIITPSGKLTNLRPVSRRDSKVHIAWLGGLDKNGRHVDNRTDEQQETLFNSLIVLSERFDQAGITGAGELYPYGFANPGFDLKAWLQEYIPVFLDAV